MSVPPLKCRFPSTADVMLIHFLDQNQRWKQTFRGEAKQLQSGQTLGSLLVRRALNSLAYVWLPECVFYARTLSDAVLIKPFVVRPLSLLGLEHPHQIRLCGINADFWFIYEDGLELMMKGSPKVRKLVAQSKTFLDMLLFRGHIATFHQCPQAKPHPLTLKQYLHSNLNWYNQGSSSSSGHKSLSNDRHIAVPTILSSTRMRVPIAHDITSGSQQKQSTYVYAWELYCHCYSRSSPAQSPEVRLMHPQSTAYPYLHSAACLAVPFTKMKKSNLWLLRDRRAFTVAEKREVVLVYFYFFGVGTRNCNRVWILNEGRHQHMW